MNILFEKARNILEQLNDKITDTLGTDYVLGHSYFMKIENDDDLKFVLEYKIKPLLEEYFYGDKDGPDEILEIVNFL
jgi:5-methylcytosine-specific restriction protein B